MAPPQVKRFATLPPDACLDPPLVAMWRNVEAGSERYQVRLLGSAAGQLDTRSTHAWAKSTVSVGVRQIGKQTGCPWSRPRVSLYLSIYLYLHAR